MKRLFSTLIILILFAGTGGYAAAQGVERDTVIVYFRVSDSNLDPGYMDNGARLRNFISKIQSSDKPLSDILVSSGSSPEGSLMLNRTLSQGRSEAVQSFLRDSLGFTSSFKVETQAVRWTMLGEKVAAAGPSYSEAVQKALQAKPDSRRIDMLKAIDGGKAWNDMKERFFPLLRTTYVTIAMDNEEEIASATVEKVQETIPEIVPETLTEPVPVAEDEDALEEQRRQEAARQMELKLMAAANDMLEPDPRGMWVKTNLLAWAAFQMNAAVEFELFDHFTISLPVYYGSFNWFVETIKFNTLEFRPELRYWLRNNCTGPFAAIHGTVGLYNYALGGELRYQDHDGKTPAYGGGLTIGWRLPLNIFGTDRWGLEFALGAAALKLNYDTFYNMANGNYYEKDLKKTYFGIDNISVTLTYRFDSKRRFR